MVNQIYPSELQLDKANSSDIEALFLDLHLTISDGSVSSKIYDKRDDFDFYCKFSILTWECSSYYNLVCLHSSAYSDCWSV